MIEPIFHSPSVEEISARVARVQHRMGEEQLDWYVSFQPDNVYYLTNFANFVHERPFLLLIPARGTPVFLVPKLELPHVRARSVGNVELIDYFEFPAPEGENWFDRMRSVIGGAARVGVETACQLHIYHAIHAERVVTDIIDALRMVKSPYEIGRMAYAANIASAAMLDLLAKAEPGRSLMEVMSRGKSLMMSALIKDDPSINPLATRADAVFQPARYSDDPHNFTDLAMAMEPGGPHVSIVNAVLNGYGSEIERTFFIGNVPEAAKRPFETMMRARELAFELARPGAHMGEIDRAVNALFKAAGYEDNLLHRTGHGMGVTGHEAPFLADGETRLLEPGMTLTIEPGIYLPGIGGFRHSDTVLVTDDGNLSLTRAPDQLEAMRL